MQIQFRLEVESKERGGPDGNIFPRVEYSGKKENKRESVRGRERESRQVTRADCATIAKN